MKFAAGNPVIESELYPKKKQRKREEEESKKAWDDAYADTFGKERRGKIKKAIDNAYALLKTQRNKG